MSQPAASNLLRRASISADNTTPGVVFRLQAVVRRDILTAAGFGSIGCLVTALYTLQVYPDLHTPMSLVLLLAAEVAGLALATTWVVWALGLAIRVDAKGIHRFNLLFPEWRVRQIAWDDLGGAAPRPWLLSFRAGYPPERIVLIPLDGPEEILPPLEDQRRLLEMARRHIGNPTLGPRNSA